jgi:hypothetical protein
MNHASHLVVLSRPKRTTTAQCRCRRILPLGRRGHRQTRIPTHHLVILSCPKIGLRYRNHEQKTHKDRHHITRNGRHSQTVQNTLDNLGITHLTSSCEMHHSRASDA